jgi:hypothetical protein
VTHYRGERVTYGELWFDGRRGKELLAAIGKTPELWQRFTTA